MKAENTMKIDAILLPSSIQLILKFKFAILRDQACFRLYTLESILKGKFRRNKL